MTRRLRWLRLLAGFCAIAAFASCATLGVKGDRSSDAGLAQAHALLWEFYGCPGHAPEVLVVPEGQLTCMAPSGFPGFRVAMLTGWECREGYTLVPGKVSISDRRPWSQGPLKHEDIHACQAAWGVIDPGHKREQDWGRLPAAREMLQGRGL